MNNFKSTGLGEPELIGKKSLFQPPSKKQPIQEKTFSKRVGESVSRLRITTDLSQKAMGVIQQMQHEHRLRTGKSLPAWKIISEALELYVKHEKEPDAKTDDHQ